MPVVELGRLELAAFELIDLVVNPLQAVGVGGAVVLAAGGVGDLGQRLFIDVDLHRLVDEVAEEVAARIRRQAARAGTDGVLNRFIQPDTLIPDSANPQAWNRYSYVYRNPMRYIDLTGHEVCDEDGNCFNQGRRYSAPKRHPIKSKSIRHWSPIQINADNVISEGTVYYTQEIVPEYQMQNIQLSTKAVPPGVPGLSPDIDLQSAPWWYIVSEGLGVVTDMQLDVEFYPVETKIHWQLKESGLWITNVEVYNFLPDVVRWEDVHFSALFMGNTIEVSESLGINDSTSVDLNFQPYTNVDTTMKIRMRADGSFPPNASVAIVMPSGAIPPVGCSILR